MPFPGRPLITTLALREIEKKGVPEGSPPFMERAGLALAEMARQMAKGGLVAVVAGPGNNGGDGLVAARYLMLWGCPVEVLLLGQAEKFPEDAACAWRAWMACGGEKRTRQVLPTQASDIALPSATLYMDALFGVGISRPITGIHEKAIEAMNASGIPVLAVDVPSGLDAQTGRVWGRAARASATLTFFAAKPGLFTLDGPDHAGNIEVDPLGVDPFADTPPEGFVLDGEGLADFFYPRKKNTHKGDYGRIGIVGGAPGMAGAVILACRAALRLGAGLVTAGFLRDPPAYDPLFPEIMARTAKEVLAMGKLDVLAVGPGLGQSKEAKEALEASLAFSGPLVLDADALNLLAGQPDLQDLIRARQGATFLTPHPLEAARLLQITAEEVQKDRVASAKALSLRFSSHIVLKGAGSVLAAPEGPWFINASGNPGMASGGMGDTLTGFLALLAAQIPEPLMALAAAVYLHGACGDEAVQESGQAGLLAHDLFSPARKLIAHWAQKRGKPIK